MVAVEFCEGGRKTIERSATDDLQIVRATQIEGDGGFGWEVFEILTKIFAPAATTFTALEAMEEAFQDDVGALDYAHPAAECFWQGDDVAEQRWAMTVEMVEDQIDGRPLILGWTAVGSARAQRLGELFEARLDVA
ncbi:MAG: hypothetical protein UY74_C0001G0002 [Candidatus Kaiserbacteria bacterium GW2011_GWC2_52_8b]|uniref:Uncharacterized protein n=1 Tax=Candidatus Kaiserbacteria bacterium GW2011_GWC2_52_8b TaxID=1618676 RepID=A0A0G2AHI6_9BACT|nr:MAG: hypothetical protein UY74_C0001G0002 [Candidatus Kaiserbacteria bacterium GW2011_GWC2_52_8b]